MHLKNLEQQSISSLRSKSTSEVPSPRKTIAVPAEILFAILGHVVAGFIDLAITKPREDSSCETRKGSEPEDESNEDSDSDSDSGSDTADASDATDSGFEEDSDDASDSLWDKLEAADKLPNGTIIALLFVSYPFRDITLKILSEALCIKQKVDGSLERNPWTVIKAVRRIYRLGQATRLTNADVKSYHTCSPVLLAYTRLSYSEFALRSIGSPVQEAFKIINKGIRVMETDEIDIGIDRIKQEGLRDRLKERLRDFRIRWHVVLHLHVHSHRLSDALEAVMLYSAGDETCLEDLDYEIHCMKHCTGGCGNTVTTPHGSPMFTQDLLVLSGIMNTVLGFLDSELPDTSFACSVLDLMHFWGTFPCEQPYLNLE